jgi:hypothetical protein
MWSLLLVTLPTQPNAVRLRIWRALKALGCAALRDGAYVLPSSEAPALEALAVEVHQNGGTASVLSLSPRDEAQRLEVLAQFDRTEAYATWYETVKVAFAVYQTLTETEARKRLRSISEALQAIKRIDYYPGTSKLDYDAMLTLLRKEFDARFSKGEPHAVQSQIAPLDAAKFQGKRWATRARPWVDRMACAWLIARFIDKTASFVWLQDIAKLPRGAVGFDFDGARFSHVGTQAHESVTFEVLMQSFGLDTDAQLKSIAQVVHYLDAGGIPVAQAAGLEAVLGGLREVHADDDALIKATAAVFDALYANAASAAKTANTPNTKG